MTVSPLVLVRAMLAFSIAGGMSVKQFSVTRDVLWIITTYSLLSLSNVFWILVIDQYGLARKMILASAGQLILTVLLGFFHFGERLETPHWVAPGLACVSVVVAVFQGSPAASKRTSQRHFSTPKIGLSEVGQELT